MTYAEQQERTRALGRRLVAEAGRPMERSAGRGCASEALTARQEDLCWRRHSCW
jgi:hypothetical protein